MAAGQACKAVRFPKCSSGLNMTLVSTITDGGDFTDDIAGMTSDHITANAGRLLFNLWILSSNANHEFENCTGFIHFGAGAGDPITRIDGNGEVNLYDASNINTSITAELNALTGSTGIFRFVFDDVLGGNGVTTVKVIGTVSTYVED